MRHFKQIAIIAAAVAAVSFAGCEPEHWQQADRIVHDVNAWAETGQGIIESPAGQTLPPDWRLIGGLATSLVLGGAAAYNKWRLNSMTKTTKAIVKGIERAEMAGEGVAERNSTSPLKAAIADEMRRKGVFDAGNRIVDRLKND